LIAIPQWLAATRLSRLAATSRRKLALDGADEAIIHTLAGLAPPLAFHHDVGSAPPRVLPIRLRKVSMRAIRVSQSKLTNH
jgi:hypothetical protein